MQMVNGSQMRAIDKKTIEEIGIPSAVLMENAARAIFDVCNKETWKSFRIFCGKGNNAGDGYALARYLHLAGKKVEIVSLCDDLKGDALIFREVARNLKIPIVSFDKIEDKPFDVLVDAMLGTGIKGELSPEFKAAVNKINAFSGTVISVDIPSGVCADTGAIMGLAVRADLTVTLALPKLGLMTYPGREYAGEIIIKDIGIPPCAVEESRMHYVDADMVHFPKRGNNTHKGSFGRVLAIGGSLGMAGAPCLCANAAVKTGSGLVCACVPESIILPVSKKLTEAMAFPYSSNDSDEFLKKLKEADAVALGCGMGNTEDTARLAEKVIMACPGKVVLDADGLNSLADRKDLFKGTIITPHPGEMARLTGKSIKDVQNSRVETARDFAIENGCTVVLKGAGTVIATENGEIFINSTGNPGMATGGSGDVLCGIIASFLGQGMKRKEAAVFGAYIHGRAGDLASMEKGEMGLISSDIIEKIPYILKERSC